MWTPASVLAPAKNGFGTKRVAAVTTSFICVKGGGDMSLTVEQLNRRLEQTLNSIPDEDGATEYYRLKRDFEMEYAKKYVAAEGSPMDKKQAALVEMDKTYVYANLKEAEGKYEGWRAAMRTNELRATICQSLLKSERPFGG